MFKIGDKVVAVKEGKHLDANYFNKIKGLSRVVSHVGGEGDYKDEIYKGLIRTAQPEGEPFSLGVWWCAADCFELADGKKKRGKREPKKDVPVGDVVVTKDNTVNGDIIICKNNKEYEKVLTLDKEYIVVDINKFNNNVTVNGDRFGIANVYPHRFIKKPKERAIMNEVKIIPKAKPVKPVKEKKPNKFDVGDRVKVLPIHLDVSDIPHNGAVGELGEAEVHGKVFTIKTVSLLRDMYLHSGYTFEEDPRFTWDERYLKRVRKAPNPKGKPEVKAPKAKVPAKPVEMIPSTVWNSPVGTKLIAIAEWPYEGRDRKHYEIGDVFTVKEGFQTNEIVWITGEKRDGGYYRKDFVLYQPRMKAPKKPAKPKAAPVMERVPLTKENAVVGMKVICVDARPRMVNDNKYKINRLEGQYCWVDGYEGMLYLRRFVVEQPVGKKKKAADVKAAIIPKAQHIHNDLLEGLARRADDGAGTCSYAIKYADGYIDYHVRDACHRRIGGRGNGYYGEKVHGQRIALALNIKGHLPTVKGNEANYLRYVNYIISQSPHRDSFLSKGVDHALKNGILMNTEWCVERLAGGAVALREGSEYKGKLNLFGELLDAGYSGHVAYTLSYGFTQDYKYSGISDAHASISGTMSADSYFKFFKEGYPDATNKRVAFNKSDECYEGICRYLDWKLPGKSINDFLREETAIKGAELVGWDAPKANPVEERKAKLYALADKLELLLY